MGIPNDPRLQSSRISACGCPGDVHPYTCDYSVVVEHSHALLLKMFDSSGVNSHTNNYKSNK